MEHDRREHTKDYAHRGNEDLYCSFCDEYKYQIEMLTKELKSMREVLELANRQIERLNAELTKEKTTDFDEYLEDTV